MVAAVRERVEQAIARAVSDAPALAAHTLAIDLAGPDPGLILVPGSRESSGVIVLVFDAFGHLMLATTPPGMTGSATDALATLVIGVGAACSPIRANSSSGMAPA
ncbi:MAG: hypothetical protein ACYDCK_09850 [Thermoplasmatota archaeon]